MTRSDMSRALLRVSGGSGVRDEADRLGREVADGAEVAPADEVPGNHPRPADGAHGGQREVLGEVRRTDTAGGHEPDSAERRRERGHRLGAAGGAGGEELHGAQAEL